MTELINKKEMMRLFRQMWMQENTTMEEDLELWGIDPDAFEWIANDVCRMSIADLLRNPSIGNLKLEIMTAFSGGFNLGYLCALEVEMRRQASE